MLLVYQTLCGLMPVLSAPAAVGKGLTGAAGERGGGGKGVASVKLSVPVAELARQVVVSTLAILEELSSESSGEVRPVVAKIIVCVCVCVCVFVCILECACVCANIIHIYVHTWHIYICSNSNYQGFPPSLFLSLSLHCPAPCGRDGHSLHGLSGCE